jgi:hypothetical protein
VEPEFVKYFVLSSSVYALELFYYRVTEAEYFDVVLLFHELDSLILDLMAFKFYAISISFSFSYSF